ncbi:hypothetical protein SAMN06265338_1061 [Rhodoblastus acidophilus]|uniref:Uncharacterized protein n=1 Tax=Rhodoblastus acidophilus TaxID=1074 RepID=A0A212RNM7_RHOAC|nr:hypothetical protein [Rhodoblastus acidophilus]SNB74170.1 hypothetical protein SAMN06265338_1061 [Rhodoblastus acidophilus]
MSAKDKNLIPAEERQLLYIEYGGYDGVENILRELCERLSDYLSAIAQPEVVNQALIRILAPDHDRKGTEILPSVDWRKVLDDTSGLWFTELPIGGVLFQLGAYANYGIVMSNTEGRVDDAHKKLEELIERAETFYKLSPLDLWGIEPNNDLQKLVQIASNRWALDNGRPVEPVALAIFGGVSEGRMRNMTSGQNKTFSLVDGRIPAQEALAWLSTRDEFWNSIWREDAQPQYGMSREAPIKEAIFLPVARDGSVFHPGLYRGSGYTIGPKGSEDTVEHFENALKTLQEMPTPYWRRPNEKGNWGIVVGIEWARFDASELDAIARTPGYRVSDRRNA